jgi:hypothetical protein
VYIGSDDRVWTLNMKSEFRYCESSYSPAARIGCQNPSRLVLPSHVRGEARRQLSFRPMQSSNFFLRRCLEGAGN